MFTQHGNKSRIVKNIVHEAVKLTDNVSIFVHSSPPLSFFNSVLKHKKHRIYNLTPMKNRQNDIDRFNEETGDSRTRDPYNYQRKRKRHNDSKVHIFQTDHKTILIV